MAVRTVGDPNGIPVLFLHGNVASSRFFEEMLDDLADLYWGIAPDLRGFGESQTKPVDATRGLRDFSDDLRSLVEALELTDQPIHLVGWGMGGGVIMQYLLDYPAHVATMTLLATVSPYGFGGTGDVDGRPIWPDFAGSGGGAANQEFVKRLANDDTSTENLSAPRNVMNKLYFKPPFSLDKQRENEYVMAMNRTVIGDDNYPGDLIDSAHWPYFAPGRRGVLNAMSPAYCNLSAIVDLAPKPPILWVRGDRDLMVSDRSVWDVGVLGQMGNIPDWPGAEIYPSQPMIGQIRAVLDRYAANGGSYVEEIIADCGHTPHIEKKEEFLEAFALFLRRHL
ncbi:MAG: alpha/beta fold hydrolase [Caldilineaceae bacterium]|nr:alpha/beta fold hydrolase [Caldilineaceae bacterium]